MTEDLEKKFDEMRNEFVLLKRDVTTLVENIPLLRRAATDHDLRQAIRAKKKKISKAAWRYLSKSEEKKQAQNH